ncbi:MAG: hypothetical protein ACOX0R_03720 [Candidatus Dojkabacteria bacterium]|jgi:hypothetical protein
MSTIEKLITPTLEDALKTTETPKQETFGVERPEVQKPISAPVTENTDLPVSTPVKDPNPSVVDNETEWTGYGYEPQAVDTDGNTTSGDTTSGDTASKIVVDKRNGVGVTVD